MENENYFVIKTNLEKLIESKYESNSLNILLVSDIHNHWDNLKKLQKWHEKYNNNYKFDYVFGLGDFDVIRPCPGDLINENNNDYTNLTSILKNLEFFEAPILYIPGNHDPIGLFNENPNLSNLAINIQINPINLAKGLQVIGFGGSINGMKTKNGESVVIKDAYPYYDDEDYGNDLFKLIDKRFEKVNKNQTILLTHTSSYSSSTTIIYSESNDTTLTFGSKAIEKVLKQSNYNILCNLHGHVHCSIGRSNIGKTQIINPGSLYEFAFGIMKLRKLNNSEWIIEKTEFIDLRAFEDL